MSSVSPKTFHCRHDLGLKSENVTMHSKPLPIYKIQKNGRQNWPSIRIKRLLTFKQERSGTLLLRTHACDLRRDAGCGHGVVYAAVGWHHTARERSFLHKTCIKALQDPCGGHLVYAEFSYVFNDSAFTAFTISAVTISKSPQCFINIALTAVHEICNSSRLCRTHVDVLRDVLLGQI